MPERGGNIDYLKIFHNDLRYFWGLRFRVVQRICCRSERLRGFADRGRSQKSGMATNLSDSSMDWAEPTVEAAQPSHQHIRCCGGYPALQTYIYIVAFLSPRGETGRWDNYEKLRVSETRSAFVDSWVSPARFEFVYFYEGSISEGPPVLKMSMKELKLKLVNASSRGIHLSFENFFC